ncbi:MAG: 3-dehydroquinate synthase [Anaerolineae bacterium]
MTIVNCSQKLAIRPEPSIQSTEVVMCCGLLEMDVVALALKSLGSRFAIVCDSLVESLIGAQFLHRLQKKGLHISLFSFPAGELFKTRETKEKLEDEMFSQGFGRDCCIIALGGGVCCDLAGFLASTFCRGVPLVLIPTTLLAMVDGCIGGKTGVNAKNGKNLIGTFYPARSVFLDPALLQSLPLVEVRNGTAEIIKHGLISSKALFQQIEGHLHKWEERDEAFLSDLIWQSCLIKKTIVEQDLQDRGARRLLNFGHTIGHGIEFLTNYEISHGEAIAFGMVIESILSVQVGFLSREELKRIIALFKRCGFSFALPRDLTFQNLVKALQSDKKAIGNTPRFVILEGIGKAASFQGEFCVALEQEQIAAALHWFALLQEVL